MRGIQTVTVLFERHPRCIERLRREAEVARGQRDLGLDTPSACYGFFRTEGRAALRSSSFARAYSPSCAIVMPRSASAGGSSRKATRFNAPRGSPAASARAAAAVINESIGIPPHLSLPPFRHPAVNIAHGHRVKPRTATRTKDIRRAFETSRSRDHDYS
jgi:hypothetical protein